IAARPPRRQPDQSPPGRPELTRGDLPVRPLQLSLVAPLGDDRGDPPGQHQQDEGSQNVRSPSLPHRLSLTDRGSSPADRDGVSFRKGRRPPWRRQRAHAPPNLNVNRVLQEPHVIKSAGDPLTCTSPSPGGTSTC